MRNVPGWGIPTGRRDGGRGRTPLARGGLMAALLLLNLAALAALFVAGAPGAHAAPQGSLNIKVPKAATNGVARGPVGANVSVAGSANAGDTYQLGYATVDLGCAAAFKSLAGVTAKADGSGNFGATFAWPASAGAGGTNYVVCAQDATIAVGTGALLVQSTEQFHVEASEPPSISIQTAPDVGGTPTPIPAPPDGHFYAGSRIQIIGTNFYPSGTILEAYVTTNPNFSASDPRNFSPLAADGGAKTFTSQSNGGVAVIVTLPSNLIGKVYLYVVSKDYVIDKYLPALVASQPIQIDRAPTPTPPTVTPTVRPSPSTTAGTGGGGSAGTPDAAGVLAVVGLTGLSIILFIVGIILMTSASAMPRAHR